MAASACRLAAGSLPELRRRHDQAPEPARPRSRDGRSPQGLVLSRALALGLRRAREAGAGRRARPQCLRREPRAPAAGRALLRSEEHTSELQSLMRISYAVFCLKTK